MTNGEMIKRMFPNETDFETDFDEDWWNAEYTGGFVEGLLKKVESEKYCNQSGLPPASKAMRDWNKAFDCCIKIIKEYCGE